MDVVTSFSNEAARGAELIFPARPGTSALGPGRPEGQHRRPRLPVAARELKGGLGFCRWSSLSSQEGDFPNSHVSWDPRVG